VNAKQIGLEIVLIAFTALTAYTVYQHGYLGFFAALTANVATVTASVDLVIALSLVMAWMWRDASEREVAVFPYLLLTALLGSIGPLLYLIRRAGSEPAHSLSSTPRSVRT
jgi:MFS superfamily sulfate permease-like transporter